MDARIGPSPRPRLRGWHNGQVALDERPPAGQPDFIRLGPYAETREFVTALLQGRPPWPPVAEVYPPAAIGFRFDPSKGDSH